MDHSQQNTQRTCRVGIDFGAGSLVIGIATADNDVVQPLPLPGISEDIPVLTGSVPAVPALLCYNVDGEAIIGEAVVRAGLAGGPATARWIRNYLLEESTVQVPAGSGRLVLYRSVAADFLSTILLMAVKESGNRPEAIFSIPDNAPEWYVGWLAGLARAAGFTACRTVGEHAAAVTGYGLPVAGGQDIIILRFDESGLSVTIVRSGEGEIYPLGEACDITGCRDLDTWIARDIVDRARMPCTGVKAQRLAAAVMARIGEIRTQLATGSHAALEIADSGSGYVLPVYISQKDLCRVLAEHGFGAILEQVTSRALAASRSRGLRDEMPVAVILLGRGCTLQAVQDCIREQFTGIPVLADHSVDALARGAAGSLSAEGKQIDRIENDYTLRYWDAVAREHRYRFLVHSGARYPSAGQVARITISAAYDGQTRLGIPLYEIISSGSGAPVLELVSDPGGGMRVAVPVDDAGEERRPVPVNEWSPTLLTADPPAVKGEPRFELTFTLDRQKQLCVTARDLVTGMLVKKDAPVHRLT